MTIMAVDDERLALDTIVRLLEKIVPQAKVTGFTKAQEAFAFLAESSVDVALLDIHMGKFSGIELAQKCKDLCPNINIVFVTGYSHYAMEAHKLHASGYLMKPVLEEDLLHELENLRHPLPMQSTKRIRVQTFGNFEIFVDGEPLTFPRTKCKECLAYLIDRKGAVVTTREIAAILWEEQPYVNTVKNSTQKVLFDMVRTLKRAGVQDILIKKYNSLAIDVEKIDCDYYHAINGNVTQINAFTGEYMNQYSWGEFTLGGLTQKQHR